jgi:hypothetical protein
VALALVALAVIVSTHHRLSAADVVFSALLAALAAAEIELDQRLFGMPVVDYRFFRPGAVAWPVQVLAGSLVVAVPLALVAYAVPRWRELWAEVKGGVGDRWLRLLVTGLVLMAIAQVWERELNHVLPLPKYFLEEVLEVIGTTYLALAMVRRRRAARRWSPRLHDREPARLAGRGGR